MNRDKKEIVLTNDSVLMDIQNAFTTLYPFLKIDFLQTCSPSRSVRSILMHPLTSLKQLKNINTSQKINIDINRTVAEMSSDLESALGLVVEVSRKSGNVWNVISLTDSWTLENQNAAGKFICSEMASPKQY
ncbi:MAG: hypothetical protein JWQ09_959 [Segetibacter sp.]|nr:hypothetical protein [Segetibacter sp.]